MHQNSGHIGGCPYIVDARMWLRTTQTFLTADLFGVESSKDHHRSGKICKKASWYLAKHSNVFDSLFDLIVSNPTPNSPNQFYTALPWFTTSKKAPSSREKYLFSKKNTKLCVGLWGYGVASDEEEGLQTLGLPSNGRSESVRQGSKTGDSGSCFLKHHFADFKKTLQKHNCHP